VCTTATCLEWTVGLDWESGTHTTIAVLLDQRATAVDGACWVFVFVLTIDDDLHLGAQTTMALLSTEDEGTTGKLSRTVESV